MHPYHCGPTPLGEAGVPMQYYNNQQLLLQQQQQQQVQVQAQAQQLLLHRQQQQPQHHQYYHHHAQYHGMVSQNGVVTPQVPYYPARGVVCPSTYYNPAHHIQHQQRQASAVVYGGVGRAGYASYAPSGYNMGFHAPKQQQQQQQQQQAKPQQTQQPFYRDGYRGGRIRGGLRGAQYNGGDARESFFAVHLKDFDELDEVRRRGSLRESLHPTVLGKMNRRASAGTLKILVLIERCFLAACMSVPRSEDDVILSKEIASQFLDVQNVHCDDGIRLVELEDGAHVARHVYATLRTALAQLTLYDKPQPTTEQDVGFLDSPGKLLKDIVSKPAVFAAFSRLLTCDDVGGDAASDIWMQLLLEPVLTTGGSDLADGSQQQAQLSKSSPTALLPSSGVGIFATAQGTRLFSLALAHPSRREALFRVLADAALPPLPEKASESPETSTARSSTPTACAPEQLFLALFSCSLASRFVFECFGLVEGTERCDKEVSILCAGMERLALKVVCSNGGSFIMTALVKALCPSRFKGGQRTSGKRVRDAEADQKQTQPQHQEQKQEREQVIQEDAMEEAQQQDDENGKNVGKKETDPNNNTNGSDARCALTQLTPTDVQLGTEPLDWRLFYAVARAFVSGAVPGDSEEDAATLARRVKLLTQHVVACRAIQGFVPFFADAIAKVQMVSNQQRQESNGASPKAAQFYDDCVKILGEITNQTGLLVNHSYGNYVLQTVITELAQRSLPETPIRGMLHKVFDALASTIFDVSVQKFASNCVETAIDACDIIPDGNALLLRFATALLAEGPNKMAQVALQQFGNYVVRKLLDRLTAFATNTAPATDAEVMEARALELQYFQTLTLQFHQLRQTSYGAGLLAWVQNQRDRIRPPMQQQEQEQEQEQQQQTQQDVVKEGEAKTEK